MISEWEGAVIDPKLYLFEKTTEVGLAKSPYIDHKKNECRGHKFDAWNGTKFRASIPENVPVNTFPIIFKFLETSERETKDL